MRGAAQSRVNHGILRPVRHEYRRRPVSGSGLGGQFVGQRQIARKPDHAGQLLGQARTGKQRHRPALREAREHDARRGNAARVFALDERAQRRIRAAHPNFVFGGLPVEPDDVVPGPHWHAAVKRYRTHRRVRKHETQGATTRTHQLRNRRFKIVTVGAQAVQPDDRGRGLGAGFDLDCFKCCWFHSE